MPLREPAGGGFRPGRLAGICAALLGLLLLVLLAGLSVGAAPVRPWVLLSRASNVEEAARARDILLGLRLPRILLAAVVGAALSAAGVTFQAVLRNPLADPYILGVSGGAALGAILTAAFGAGDGTASAAGLIRSLFAFGGAAGTLLLLFALARASGRISNTSLLLTGAVVNAFFSALILFIITVVDYTRFQSVFFWLVGTIEPSGYGPLAATAACVAGSLLGLVLLSGRLNLLSLGDDEARSLGVEPDSIKKLAIIAASLATASAVSMSGLIGFVGLMVPHATRAVLGSDHRSLLPAAALGGAIFLVAADTAARTLLAPVEMPVGIITAVCGGPFFLYLFQRRRAREMGG